MEKLLLQKILKEKKWERFDCGQSLPARSYYIPRGSAKYTDMCGEWDFLFSPDIRKLDVSKTPEKIKVPSCWQNEGYDSHQYLNTRYPIPFRPPHVPEANPAALYSKTVRLDNNPKMRTYINIAGADSFYIIFVNGHEAGCHMISHSGAEFDITEFLISGDNVIEILLLKWSTGTYLECQDKFRMSGIFREVYILEREEGHITDYKIRADFEKSYIAADIDITFLGGTGKNKTVKLFYNKTLIASGSSIQDKIKLTINEPVLWNAENPELYDIKICCGGEIIEDIYALRDIKTESGILKLNGQKIKLRGVNRHESYYDGGYVTDKQKMLHDFRLMKDFNINAIRTSHYPDTPEFYRLCDMLGFYVIDEADIETHGANELGGGYGIDTITDDLKFCPIIEQRVLTMYERDKNRGSVILWSLGNESGWGRCLINAADKLKNRDSRPIHYENVYGKPENTENSKMLDVWSRMYPSLAEVEKYLTSPVDLRPLVLCEYTHAMGNSCGDAIDYEKLFEDNDILAGGFVWEWNDHAAKGNYKNYKNVPLYGGDFGERLHDGNFCADGLLSHERIPHSSLYEIKQAYRPLKVIKKDGWVLKNRMAFTDSVKYNVIITQYFADGTKKVSEIKTNIAPLKDAEIFPVLDKDAVGVKFEYCTKDLKSNEIHSKGFDFFELKGFDKFIKFVPIKPRVEYSAGEYKIKTENAQYTVDGRGMLSGIKVHGKELLKRACELNIMRAPIDNDRNIIHEWNKVGICDAEFFADKITAAGDSIKVIFSARTPALPDVMNGELNYQFCDCGFRITINAKVREAVRFLPRFGMTLYLDKEYDKTEFYGFGEGESYIDKHNYCEKTYHNFFVKDMLCPYLKPQEYGSHFGTEYIKLHGKNSGIVIQCNQGMSFSALPYSIKQLTQKKYNFELEKEECTILSLDYKMSGLGSNSCGPELIEKYQLNEKKINFCADMFFVKK